jgi:hypothetical protein
MESTTPSPSVSGERGGGSHMVAGRRLLLLRWRLGRDPSTLERMSGFDRAEEEGRVDVEVTPTDEAEKEDDPWAEAETETVVEVDVELGLEVEEDTEDRDAAEVEESEEAAMGGVDEAARGSLSKD